MPELSYRSELLAPSDTDRSTWSGGFSTDQKSYSRLLRSAQQLRARCYLADGAIRPAQVCPDGRFAMPGDEDSWHFLLATSDDRVVGCVRYTVYDPCTVSFEQLRVGQLGRLTDRDWTRKLVTAVEADIRLARDRGSLYAELAGWAIDEEYRGTKLALETLVASYAWGGLLEGGCICSCTATVRHGSASILRRIGGRPMATANGALPPYWDSRYGCAMEVLRFDSRVVEPRYQRLIGDVQRNIQGKAAIQHDAISPELRFQLSLANLSCALNKGRGLVPDSATFAQHVLAGRRQN